MAQPTANAFEIPILDVTFIAGADLSTKQYYPVKLNSTKDQVVLADVAGEEIIGILQEGVASGVPCSVRVLGISPAIVGAAIAKGTQLAVTVTTGKLKAASALVQATGAASQVIALALEQSTADLDLIAVLLTPGGGIKPTSLA